MLIGQRLDFSAAINLCFEFLINILSMGITISLIPTAVHMPAPSIDDISKEGKKG